MLLPAGTRTGVTCPVVRVSPVATPSTAIAVTVPPVIVTQACRQNGFTSATVVAGTDGATPAAPRSAVWEATAVLPVMISRLPAPFTSGVTGSDPDWDGSRLMCPDRVLSG